MKNNDYERVAEILTRSSHTVAFTGAGVSVESGIPAFRGPTGLWSRYDPKILDIDYFMSHPKASWGKIREIFYDYMLNVEPNDAHRFLAWLEKQGLLKAIITQNIDNLHQKAGSRNVIEYHGTANHLTCLACKNSYRAEEISLESLPPACPGCGGLLKPDFVFFGEPIPASAQERSLAHCAQATCLLIIGTTGEIMPASQLPYTVPKNCDIIEINIEESSYTPTLTDIFLNDKAGSASKKLWSMMER